MTDDKGLMIIDPQEALERAQARTAMIDTLQSNGTLRDGIDYGKIPGTKSKTLLKPGAERLCSVFGLQPEFTSIESITEWEAQFFAHTSACALTHIVTGMVLVKGVEGHCNNRERKYWDHERDVAKGDVYMQVNTVIKMAQKRALVAAVLIATNASDQFTQDMEDIIEQPQRQSPLKTPRPKRVNTQEPKEIPEAPEIGEGEVRSVIATHVIIQKTGNGKPFYILQDSNGQGSYAWERTVFAEAGYISKEEWEGESGTIIPLNPYIPFLARMERGKDGNLYKNVVIDSIPKLTPEAAFGDTGVTAADAIPWSGNPNESEVRF